MTGKITFTPRGNGAFVAFAALPQAADAAQFGIARLRQTSSTGAENYLYTDGGVVFAQATVDAAYYRFSVVDRPERCRLHACAQSLSKRARTSSTRSSRPTRRPARRVAVPARRVEQLRLQRRPDEDGSKYFDIARASSFADAALPRPARCFAAGSSAYVSASRDRRRQAERGQHGPERLADHVGDAVRRTACANTANADRPDASAAGVLAVGSYLKYRPNAAAPSARWNLSRTSRRGRARTSQPRPRAPWKVRLQKDGTHFVTLKAFDVDARPPTPPSPRGPPAAPRSPDPDLAFVASQPTRRSSASSTAVAGAACTSPKHYSGLSESAAHVPGARRWTRGQRRPDARERDLDRRYDASRGHAHDPANGVCDERHTPDNRRRGGNATGRRGPT
jgi:hypothetical protein